MRLERLRSGVIPASIVIAHRNKAKQFVAHALIQFNAHTFIWFQLKNVYYWIDILFQYFEKWTQLKLLFADKVSTSPTLPPEHALVLICASHVLIAIYANDRAQ